MLLVPVEGNRSGVLEAQGRAGQNRPSNGRQRVLESETRRERDCFSSEAIGEGETGSGEGMADFPTLVSVGGSLSWRRVGCLARRMGVSQPQ